MVEGGKNIVNCGDAFFCRFSDPPYLPTTLLISSRFFDSCSIVEMELFSAPILWPPQAGIGCSNCFSLPFLPASCFCGSLYSSGILFLIVLLDQIKAQSFSTLSLISSFDRFLSSLFLSL